MQKQNVKVGTTYIVKVNSTLVKVRLTCEHDRGGWYGTNLATGREIRIRTAASLRGEVTSVAVGRFEQINNQRLQGLSYDAARKIVDQTEYGWQCQHCHHVNMDSRKSHVICVKCGQLTIKHSKTRFRPIG